MNKAIEVLLNTAQSKVKEAMDHYDVDGPEWSHYQDAGYTITELFGIDAMGKELRAVIETNIDFVRGANYGINFYFGKALMHGISMLTFLKSMLKELGEDQAEGMYDEDLKKADEVLELLNAIKALS